MKAIADWWNSITLRSKITGVTVIVLTFGLLVTGAGTVIILKQALIEQAKAELVAFATGDISRYIDVDDEGARHVRETNEYYIALYDADGTLIDHNWDDRESRLLPRPAEGTISVANAISTYPRAVTNVIGSEFQAVTVVSDAMDDRGTNGVVFIARSMRGPDSVVATYLTIFFGLGLGVIVLGALITRVLVTNTLHPLREAETTAAHIAGGDFSQRLTHMTPNTEVGRLNRSLNTMLNRIDRAFKDRAQTIEQMRRFVGDASHELRTPLVTVRGYAELYRMGALEKPEDVAQAMERIEKEAVRMSGMVQDLLELARLDEARPRELTRIDLTPLAKDAVMDARASYPGRPVSFVIDTPPDSASLAPEQPATSPEPEPRAVTRPNGSGGNTGPIALAGATFARLRGRRPRKGAETAPSQEASKPVTHITSSIPTVPAIVMGEENKIRQVIANLMGNAMRFTPDGSPIEVGVSANPLTGMATVAVIDHGEGVPEPIREKIFQRFWRADSSRTRETGGSGLGLAIVSSIVAAHNGSVDVNETPGGGATFRIRLPLASTVSESPSATES
ncbi:sensor histidine kinase [Paramicrobacterium agarici]|uniref:histidine kinase n=1 Tax=Paramicrobacterium agarici TaxID=630514 RepID=A0A2A9DXZ1_9MICO|nr:HAMP domain-containing sensor histidine kinase [Microbacterium agarici]PFG30799.1 two-component system OmpR family sensor kinase [Microbacterium agarici]TQO23866.1 two-component system OmpR family sensor kinase [Microbacterium agarici]